MCIRDSYKAAYAFYVALLGWTPGEDTGSQNECKIGDVGGIIIRASGGGGGGGRNAGRGAAAGDPPALVTPAAPSTPRAVSPGHIAFGITPWDADTVKAELEKRGL